jgi:acetoin utilization deacetylase AcuC-like enzyme
MDPLAGFQFESQTYHMLCGALTRLAQELCGGRCMFILEGGYHQQSLAEAVVDSFAGVLGLPVLSSSSGAALPDEPLAKVSQV